jgi:hypothetical protein
VRVPDDRIEFRVYERLATGEVKVADIISRQDIEGELPWRGSLNAVCVVATDQSQNCRTHSGHCKCWVIAKWQVARPTVDERFKCNPPQRHPRYEDGFGRIRLGADPAQCINRGRPQNSFPQQPHLSHASHVQGTMRNVKAIWQNNFMQSFYASWA